MVMSGADYRESLRRCKPTVYVNGRQIESVADDSQLAAGIRSIALTYDYALRPEFAPVMLTEYSAGSAVNRMMALPHTSSDLLNKLEAVRLVCQETGCAPRYLGSDALSAIFQATRRIDEEQGSDYHPRFLEYLEQVYHDDLTCAIAMTDAKGDRSKRPHEQQNPNSYVHIVERRPKGIVISGTKAIVTAAPYVHEVLVMPCRNIEHLVEDHYRRRLPILGTELCGRLSWPSRRAGDDGKAVCIDWNRAAHGEVGIALGHGHGTGFFSRASGS
jgi:4-hydroxybutyryl-CoA dehydratase / vinylacetyl-CoA-Delta-isomerase